VASIIASAIKLAETVKLWLEKGSIFTVFYVLYMLYVLMVKFTPAQAEN